MCKQHDVSGDVQHTVTWDREMGEMRRGQPGERGDWWAEFTGSASRGAAWDTAEEAPHGHTEVGMQSWVVAGRNQVVPCGLS